MKRLAALVLLLPLAAVADAPTNDWPSTARTITALDGAAPSTCATVGDTVIDSDSGLVWVCTDSVNDTFRNAGGRILLKFRTSSSAFSGYATNCIPAFGSLASAPTSCANVAASPDQQFLAPANIFIGTCWGYVHSVTGTWGDGVDSITFKLRFQNTSTSTDSTASLTVDTDLTWTAAAFNEADPFADAAPTTNFIGVRPVVSATVDANTSITNINALFFCDATVWD